MAQAGGSPRGVDEDDLFSYFNKSVAAVQAHADEFERSFARPALATSQAFFDERPIAATFIASFCLLSFLPILGFTGFALFVVVSFSVIALSFAFLVSLGIIFSLLSILILILLTTFTSSVFLTSTAVSAYTAYRLTILVRRLGADGLPAWMAEMRNAIIPTQHEQKSDHAEEGSPQFEDIRELPVDVKEEPTDLSSELQSSTQNLDDLLSGESKAEVED